jgi:hypothetical protein
MQTIHITLQDPALEKALSHLTEKRQETLQDLVIAALRCYIEEVEQPVIPKLDPFQHSQAPTIAFQSDDQRVFEEIEDSAEFAKTLRRQAWRDE